jgi:hypothetical protein
VWIFDKGHCDLLEQQDYDLHQTHSGSFSEYPSHIPHLFSHQPSGAIGAGTLSSATVIMEGDEFIVENDVFKNSAP